MRKLSVGYATVHLINIGDLGFRLKDVNNVPENQWRPKYADVFENVHRYPSQCVFISLPGKNLLVDAGNYSLFATPDSEYTIPGYQSPPDLIEQLSEVGVAREDLDCVIITHAHFDHYAGVTIKSGSTYMPAFTNAKYFLGSQDFEDPEIQKSMLDPNSKESRTLGVLRKAGVLELVEQNKKILDEVEIIGSPGETAGHKIVKLHSKGQTLYCLGDLFHHSCEVENPTWMASWGDQKTNVESRQRLLDIASKENALLAPSHMPLGRVEKTSASFKYVEI